VLSVWWLVSLSAGLVVVGELECWVGGGWFSLSAGWVVVGELEC
jgi:hypothetical protein